jgi:hypothetical protein
MAKQAIWVMLKAKPGKEDAVEAFLKQGAAMSLEEPYTVTWYGVKLGGGMYGVFDTFNASTNSAPTPQPTPPPSPPAASKYAHCKPPRNSPQPSARAAA